MTDALRKAKAAEKAALGRVIDAVAGVSSARGEAQWLNGYRVGRADSDAETRKRESGWWHEVGTRHILLRQALSRYAASVRCTVRLTERAKEGR